MNSYVTGDGRKTVESGYSIVKWYKTSVEPMKDPCSENKVRDYEWGKLPDFRLFHMLSPPGETFCKITLPVQRVL